MHGSQFDGQRQAINPVADDCYLTFCIGSFWSYRVRSFAEERNGIFEWQWSQQELLLRTYMQRRAARHEDKQLGTTRKQLRDERCTIGDLFYIVEHKQEMLVL